MKGWFFMENYADKAKRLFESGYNCAQAVFCAFEDVTGMDHETAAKVASSFGGGLGRMREVCGTVSGAAMVLGMVYGGYGPGDQDSKVAHYHIVQDFCARFTAENGSIICRELLAGKTVKPGNDPEARTPEYYKKRPCSELVWLSAKIVAEMLAERENA